MKEFLIRDENAFKLRAKMRKCTAPADLNCIEFVNESYNEQGEMIESSTYQFFLEDAHIKKMAEGLLA